MAKSRRKTRWRRLLGLLLLVVGVPSLYILYLHATLTLPAGEDREPVRLYAAPFVLVPGQHVEQAQLTARLSHLGYRTIPAPRTPGEFVQSGDSYEIYLRDFLYPDGWRPAQRIRVTFQDETISRIIRLPDGKEMEAVSLDPLLIGGLLATSRQVREWVPLATMPPRLVDAVLAVEDRRFYGHPGIDVVAVLRAIWQNFRAGTVVQGGSTITQQLAKNLYYTPQRTYGRKIEEALAALILERKYTKYEILESYLNEIYFGQSGSVAVYGVGEASRHYFGKQVQDLSMAESALLAGMIKGPNTYGPIKDPPRAKKRRDAVLASLLQTGKINDIIYQAAVKSPIRPAPTQDGAGDAPYFVDYLLSQFEEPPQSDKRQGLRIFTTLDPELQRLAEEALRLGLARLESRYAFLKQRDEPLQGALVALDPKSGAVLAMVGGRDYRTGQFNHAVQAKRQAGSLFKPFVYLTAFERSLTAPDDAVTPLTRLTDAPISFPQGTGRWEPQNYDHKFHGEVTVRTALEQSLNVPAVRMAQTLGVDKVIRVLQNLGIQGSLEDNLALALGSSEVTLLEITGAFAALANEGRFVAPTPLTTIMAQSGDRAGTILLQHKAESIPGVSPQAAYLVTSLLKGVVQRGTAASAHSLGLTATVAGKTGTTDDHRDAWFVGYTPNLAVGVWVGFDGGETLKLTGAQAALPIWVDFMRRVVPADSPDFPLPPAIVSLAIDPQTFLLATSGCPESREEVFLKGTEPTQYCDVHSPGLFERFKRLFRSS